MKAILILVISFSLSSGGRSVEKEITVLTGDGVTTVDLSPIVAMMDRNWCFHECDESACMTGDHLVRNWAGPEANTDDGQHVCQSGDCGDHLGNCDFREEDELLAIATPEALHFLSERYPDMVHLNFPRGAVQVLNCAGDVSVHVPVPDDLLRELASLRP